MGRAVGRSVVARLPSYCPATIRAKQAARHAPLFGGYRTVTPPARLHGYRTVTRPLSSGEWPPDMLRWPRGGRFLVSRAQVLAQPAWTYSLLLRLLTVEGRCPGGTTSEWGEALDHLWFEVAPAALEPARGSGAAPPSGVQPQVEPHPGRTRYISGSSPCAFMTSAVPFAPPTRCSSSTPHGQRCSTWPRRTRRACSMIPGTRHRTPPRIVRRSPRC